MADTQNTQTTAAPVETTEETSLLDDVITATKLKPADEGYDIAKKGVQALMAQLVEPSRKIDKVSNAVIDELIAGIDQKLSAQLDAILHHPQFQALESSWRSLKYLVDRTEFRENIMIEMLNASKD